MSQIDKVLVIMNYDDGVKDFSDIAFQINQRYCDKHGYDLKRYNRVYDPAFNMTSQKLWLLLDVLQECLNKGSHTHVMWIDSDACFNSKSFHDLHDFLPRYDRYASFSEDMHRFSIFKQGGISMNAGVMIFRTCNESIWFFEKAIQHFLNLPKPVSFWEQGTIIHLIHTGQLSMRGLIFFPYNTLQTFPEKAITGFPPSYYDPSAFIYHFPNASTSTRIKFLTDIAANN